MKKVQIRRVWEHNLESEFRLIQSALPLYRFVSIDTEFPGTVFESEVHLPSATPAYKYQFMKANVEATNIIQLGLTLSDRHGNLPDFGTDYCCYIWEFNFSDFDIDRDNQNKDSIELLKKQGINFLENKQYGICSSDFSSMMQRCKLISNGSRLKWVTFHSAYDFGYLIKMLNQNRLPEDIGRFMWLVGFYFGEQVYDIKHMIKYFPGLYGGLEKVANTLGVDRVAGKIHQAGSDSLLTMQTFMKLKEQRFNVNFRSFRGVLHGLEVGNVNFDWFQGVLYGLKVGNVINFDWHRRVFYGLRVAAH